MFGSIRNLLFTQPTQGAQANNNPSFSYTKYIRSSIPLIGAIDEKQKSDTNDLIECLRTSYRSLNSKNKLKLSRLLSNYLFDHNSTINSRTRTLIQELQAHLKSNNQDLANRIYLGLEKELLVLNYNYASRLLKENLTHPILNETQTALSSMLKNPCEENLKQLKTRLTLFLNRKEPACYKKPLSSDQESSINELIKKLEGIKTLSSSLLPYLFDNDSNTSYISLVREAEKIITAQIESQCKWAALTNPTTLLASAFQKVSRSMPSSRAPFKALFEAINLENKEYKADLLKHILKSCFLTHPEFEDFIKNNIKELEDDELSVDEWIDRNKDKNESLLPLFLVSGFELANSKGYQYKQATYEDEAICIKETCAFLEKEISKEASKQSSNFIVDSFNEVLSSLNLGSIPTSYAQFLSKSLIFALDSSTINKWIDRQPEQVKELFEKIKNDLKQALEKASSVEDYKEAISKFLETYNSQIVTVSGFELPELLDEEEIKAKNEKVDKVDKTVENIRTALDSSKSSSEAGFDWKNPALAKEKVKKEKEKLCKNLKDQLTHELISNLTGISSQTFFNIKTLEASCLDRDKQKVFTAELKKEINSSKCNWFLKKTIIFLLPILYTIIGKYTKSLVDHIIDDVNERVETINKEVLFQRTSNCLSKYNSLLKFWADTKEGGEKNKVIGSLMKERGFLEFGKEESYSQDELYKNVSDKFVTNYFDLYKDSGNDLTIPSKIYSFVKQPIFKNRTTFVRKSINFIGVSLKYLLIGFPVTLINSPLICFEKISNALVKSLLKRFLAKNKVIDSMIKSSKESVFESNPYVYPVTSFFAEQLESISKTLSNPEKIPSDRISDEKNIISDRTHSQLKTLFELLFEVLNKNKFNTQEQLEHYLKDQSISKQSKELLDAKIIPAILDSIIDTSIMASEKLLNKDQIQKPLSLLLEELNEIVLTPKANDPERIRLQQLKNQNAQEKLNKYSKKVLSQIIDQAIDSVFQDQAETDEIKAKKFINDFKNAFTADDGMIQKGRDLVDEIHDPTHPKVKQLLSNFRERVNQLTIKIENKQDSIRKRDSRISREVKLKLENAALIFEKLITDKETNSGLIELQARQKRIFEISQDLPHFTTLERWLEGLQKDLAKIKENQPDELVARFTSTSKYLDNFFSQFESNELRLVKEEPLYEKLKTLMRQNLSSRKELAANITNKSVKRLNLLNNLLTTPALNSIKDKKKSEIEDKSLGRFFNFKKQTASAVAKELRKIANNLDSKADKEVVESCLNTVLSAKSITSLEESLKNLKDKVLLLVKEEREKLSKYSSEVSKIDDQLLSCCREITASKGILEGDIDTYVENLVDFDRNLNDLEEALSDQSLSDDLNVIHTKALPPKILKSSLHKVLYHQIYPKAEGLLNLIRDGNFAQFLINHTVLMPFAKK